MSRAATMMDSTASIAVGSPNSRTARSTASGATGTALPGRLAPCVTVTLQSLSAPAWMVTLIPAGSFFARLTAGRGVAAGAAVAVGTGAGAGCARGRSEEHTSELQSLMRNSYAVFCLQK